VEVTIAAGTATVVISGELDTLALPLLSSRFAQVMDARPGRLVINLAGVGFMDCATARLITGAGRYLPRGQRVVIRSASPPVRRLLELTGLAARCEMEE
jgi:anti-anti-sigma factor